MRVKVSQDETRQGKTTIWILASVYNGMDEFNKKEGFFCIEYDWWTVMILMLLVVRERVSRSMGTVLIIE